MTKILAHAYGILSVMMMLLAVEKAFAGDLSTATAWLLVALALLVISNQIYQACDIRSLRAELADVKRRLSFVAVLVTCREDPPACPLAKQEDR